nr:hypothetical protein [Tanacetum cinerariifolium]
MYTEIAGYVRVNDAHKLVNATLTAELERCKIEMQALERNKFKRLPHVPCPTHTSDSSVSVKSFPVLHRFDLAWVYMNTTSWLLAQNIRSSNAIALDSPYLLVLIIETSQSKHQGKSKSDSYYLSD